MNLKSTCAQLANLAEHEDMIDGGILAKKVSQADGSSLG
jgi:hypothetical protein